ncbi:MAG: mannose-1-phosphate guanylyltransferase [Chitinophagaceae bacterium]
MNKNLYIAIMAGGIGTRFWPQSTKEKPKQFLDILGVGKTLLQQTFTRSEKLCPIENIFIVTSQDYVTLVQEQLPQISKENIIAEPFRKNTAPCIAYIAYKLHLKNPEALLICKPADHIILDEDQYCKVCNEGVEFICSFNALLTIGITPYKPHTGYGYIQYVEDKKLGVAYPVKTFTEKPNVDLAQKFLESGEYLWNAGIFMWKTKNILEAFEKYIPEDFHLFVSKKDTFNTIQETRAIQYIYECITNISIDYAILEKANNVFVIPASFGWNDIGSWSSVYDISEKDSFKNVGIKDHYILVDTKDSLFSIHDKEKLLVVQGQNNMLVVDTPNALLICSKEKEQDIKLYLEEISKRKLDKYL